METLEDVLAQVGREGRLRVARLAVDRAGTAALQAATAEPVEQPQVAQDLLHADLLAEEREVDLGPSGAVRWLDRGRRRHYGGVGRGDHFFCGHVPFVAHGCFVVGGRKCAAGRVGFSVVVAGGRRVGIDDAGLRVVPADVSASAGAAVVVVSLGVSQAKCFSSKGRLVFQTAIDQMQQFAHAVAQGDVAAFAFGPEATIEGPDGRVVDDA